MDPSAPDGTPGAVGMREVAARAGVSPQTVSRVFRGSPLVSAVTAARVRAASKELNYHGNAVASAFGRGRARTIGLLFPIAYHRPALPHAEQHADAVPPGCPRRSGS